MFVKFESEEEFKKFNEENNVIDDLKEKYRKNMPTWVKENEIPKYRDYLFYCYSKYVNNEIHLYDRVVRFKLVSIPKKVETSDFKESYVITYIPTLIDLKTNKRFSFKSEYFSFKDKEDFYKTLDKIIEYFGVDRENEEEIDNLNNELSDYLKEVEEYEPTRIY